MALCTGSFWYCFMLALKKRPTRGGNTVPWEELSPEEQAHWNRLEQLIFSQYDGADAVGIQEMIDFFHIQRADFVSDFVQSTLPNTRPDLMSSLRFVPQVEVSSGDVSAGQIENELAERIESLLVQHPTLTQSEIKTLAVNGVLQNLEPVVSHEVEVRFTRRRGG